MLNNENFEILVVDDDQFTFDLLYRLGQDLFPEALFSYAASPDETTDYLNNKPGNRPKIVLLDINLRHSIDGLALLPELHTRFYNQVPIIMLTVSAGQDHIRQAYKNGATAFTTKPHNLHGWKEYMRSLRTYWYEINLLPPGNFPPFRFLQ